MNRYEITSFAGSVKQVREVKADNHIEAMKKLKVDAQDVFEIRKL